MDIPELSMAMSLSNVQSQWSIGMMSKAMDQAEVMSDSLIKMMESSVAPNLGQNIDVRL